MKSFLKTLILSDNFKISQGIPQQNRINFNYNQPMFYPNRPQPENNLRNFPEKAENPQISRLQPQSERIINYSPSDEVSAVRFSSNGLSYNF